MEQHSIIRKSAFSDFFTLYDHFNGKYNHDPEKVSKAHDNIIEAYELEEQELRLITHLVRIFPNGLLCKKIADIICLENGDYGMSIVESLRRKNFIRTAIASSGQSYIILTTDAMNAFNRYQHFGSLPEMDFIGSIRNAEPSMMNSPSWIRNFKYEMDCRKNSDFVKKWNELGAGELSESEARALCAAIRYFILHFTEPMTGKAKDINEDVNFTDIKENPTVKKTELEALVQKGFIVTKGDGYVIAPKVAEAFLHGHDEIVNYDEISNRAQVIKSCDIDKKELFFSPESQEEIEHLHYMLSREGFEHSCSVLKRKKRNPAIQSLLWGGPGTGKTETVKQIALETGRDIFLFDVAKVTASDWGATENLYRRLFDSYRYIVAVKSLTPILFINEADQVLSHRLSELDRSIDKAENTVSNILLQEFEDMHGILLATTNNAKLLDEAFDRRFLFKTELQKPDARARKSIWKSMIPELTEQEAALLAEKYVMSGAQINNVATKRDLAELYFLGDRGLSYIEMLCGKELSTEKQNPANRHIGF